MKTKILVIIDMQTDFLTGSLKNDAAVAIVPKVVEKIEEYKKTSAPVIATLDTHFADYLETQEGTLLPVEHCIMNTEGWKLHPDIENALKGYPRFKDVIKNTFGGISLPESVRTVLKYGVPAEIEIVGVMTDICVVSNALLLKAFYPEIPIYIDPVCCAGTTPEKHEAAIETMKSCQILIRE